MTRLYNKKRILRAEKDKSRVAYEDDSYMVTTEISTRKQSWMGFTPEKEPARQNYYT